MAPTSKRASASASASLREAPTFHPTAAEFENPLRYIMSIRQESEEYGICW